jgi:hypothetical protein
MNSKLKAAALPAFAILLLSPGLEANASGALNGPGGISRSAPALPVTQEEPVRAPCNLAPLMTLTGADGRSRAGRRAESPRSTPAGAEQPVVVKNPFLPAAP